jgi:hypothetical protein
MQPSNIPLAQAHTLCVPAPAEGTVHSLLCVLRSFREVLVRQIKSSKGVKCKQVHFSFAVHKLFGGGIVGIALINVLKDAVASCVQKSLDGAH